MVLQPGKAPEGPDSPCFAVGGTQGKENAQKNILVGSKHTLLPAAPPFPYLFNLSLFSLGGYQRCPAGRADRGLNAFSGEAAPSPLKSSVLQAPRSKLCFAVSMLPPLLHPQVVPGGLCAQLPPQDARRGSCCAWSCAAGPPLLLGLFIALSRKAPQRASQELLASVN